MERFILVVVDGTLAYGRAGIPADMVAPYELATTFAQAAARAASSSISSDMYFGQLVKSLTDVGWRMSDQGTTRQLLQAGRRPVADTIVELAQGYLDTGASPRLMSVMEAMASAVDPVEPVRPMREENLTVGAAELLSFWWSKVRRRPGSLGLGLVSLDGVSAEALSARVVLLQLRIDAQPQPRFAGWRSLFTPLPYESIRSLTRTLTMELDMQRWQEVQDRVLARIGTRLAEHVRHAELAAGSAPR